MTNYQRVEKAIEFITQNFRDQPDLDTVAKEVHLSPFHFQRLFKDWAGVSPKKFLQYISVGHAKKLLDNDLSVASATFDTGLSGTSRLHDLFISIEGMTPGEYRNDGKSLHINYSFAETVFGDVLVASTPKGICHLAFVSSHDEALAELRQHFSKATFNQHTDLQQQHALQLFQKDWKDLQAVKLHLKATPFQLKVWEALLKIPSGAVTTYGALAKSIDVPNAARATGSAIGSNPVAFLIPCHRAIRSSGQTGQYHWGALRKAAMIGWESSILDT